MNFPPVPPPSKTESNSIEDLRDQLVVRLLYLLMATGFLATLGSLSRVLDTGWHPLMWLHIGLYLVLVVTITFALRMGSTTKRMLMLGSLLFAGLAALVAYGLLGLGLVVLVLFCGLSAALYGERAGWAATAITILSVTVIAVLATNGRLQFAVDPPAYLYSISAWINAVAGMLVATTLTVAITGYLLQSLTARHQAQLQSAELLQSILSNSPDIVMLLDTSGAFIFISHTDPGYHTPAELVGQRMSDLAVPEHRHRLQQAIDDTVAIGRKQRVEATYLDPTGHTHPYDIHLAPVLRDGEVTALSVIARDIDSQLATESALRNERDFNTAVLETIGALVVVLDAHGNILDFNHACERVTGYTKDEVRGRKVWDFLLTPEEQPEVERVFRQITAGQFPNTHENDWVARDGARHRIAWSNTVLTGPDGRITHVIATGLDVTRMVQTEAALIRSEERLRLSQRYAQIGTWDWEIASGAIYWSEQIGPLFGYGDAVPETTYENFLNAIHPDDRNKVIAAVNASVDHNSRYDIEHRVVWPDGTVRWLLERGGTIRSSDGKPLRMLGVVQDITERKQAEAALAESEELFREFAENIEEVFWVRDLRDNRMIYVNPAYEKVWGHSRKALLADPLDFAKKVHPDDLPDVREGIRRQQQGEYFNRRYRIVRDDGEIRWVHAQAFPIHDSAGVVYRIGGFVRDITRQQLADSERLQHERNQLQTLVREVHHRIKNHLQGVVGLLHTNVDRLPEAAQPLREAITQVRSIALVHGLQGQNAQAELHLCEIVPAIAKSVMEAMSLPSGIEVTIKMASSLRITDADVVPLALVINELLMNGLKHVPADSGRQRLRLHLHERLGVGRLILDCPGSRLPEQFDFQEGRGLGTGLELVKALLPRVGAHLSIENTPYGVHCELTLQSPVVMPGSRIPAAS